MVRRLSNNSNMSDSKFSSATTEVNYHSQPFKPFPKPSPIVLLIIMVIVGFLGHAGYEAYDEIKLYQQKQKAQAKTCLMDFGKNNCNIASPNEQCAPIINCIIEDKDDVLKMMEIVFNELEQNFPIPSILVGLLLLLRLSQILSENKLKNE